MSLTIRRLLEVNIGVAEGPAGDHVPAHPNGEDGPGGAELLVEHGLGDIGVQVTHVQRRHRVTAGSRVHLPPPRAPSGELTGVLGLLEVELLVNI